MATTTSTTIKSAQFTVPSYGPHQVPPATLWIGNYEVMMEYVLLFLQQQLCPNRGCGICKLCRNITQQQHHACTWIRPSNLYTLDDLATIHTTIAYALAPHEHHFFVITKADYLTTQCANSLLKSLEEPPTGYHFILLAQKEEALVPTVRSRCVIHTFKTEAATYNQSTLWKVFTQSTMLSPQGFLKDLEKTKIHEQETLELIEHLQSFWLEQAKTYLLNNNETEYQQAQHLVTIFNQALRMPPMPGSSNLFWKNLFLQIQNIKTSI